MLDSEYHDWTPWRSITIGERAAGRRADVYLSDRFTMFSRTVLARHIKEGSITREGRALKPSTILAIGDVLRIMVPGLAPPGPPPPLPEILYEDERLLALNKPSGMLVHPSGDRFVWGIIGLVRKARPTFRIDLVHRLDRDTSGVLLITKDRDANVFIKGRLFERSVTKIYKAICRGVIPWDQKDIHGPIGKRTDSAVNLRRGVVDGGLDAHTTVTVLKRMAEHSLVSCQIHTGRTHQIRVHMEHVGFPLLGDKLYGQPDEIFLHHHVHGPNDDIRTRVQFPRHALHAARVVFPHPDGHTCTVEAPLPDPLQAIVDGATPWWDPPAE